MENNLANRRARCFRFVMIKSAPFVVDDDDCDLDNRVSYPEANVNLNGMIPPPTLSSVELLVVVEWCFGL